VARVIAQGYEISFEWVEHADPRWPDGLDLQVMHGGRWVAEACLTLLLHSRELLPDTLIVDPDHRRCGVGDALYLSAKVLSARRAGADVAMRRPSAQTAEAWAFWDRADRPW
jgi:hypothetical protein